MSSWSQEVSWVPERGRNRIALLSLPEIWGGAVMRSVGRGGGEELIVPFVSSGVSDLFRGVQIILTSGK